MVVASGTDPLVRILDGEKRKGRMAARPSFSEADLDALREVVRAVIREELDRYRRPRRPPERGPAASSVSDAERAAARRAVRNTARRLGMLVVCAPRVGER